MGVSTTCGSGKKYKNCHGKNQQYQGLARFFEGAKKGTFLPLDTNQIQVVKLKKY